MKRFVLALLLASACLLPACDCSPRPLPPIEVYFSPKGGCTDAVVRELEAAERTILVQAYSFTSAPIAKALVEAHNRNVAIQVVLDKSQRTEDYSEADFLHNAGIPVLIDAKHAIAHNKIMIIDDEVIVTGSFNFTKQAEHSNAENLLIIRDEVLAREYTANWRTHAMHSEPYEGREATDTPPPRPHRDQHTGDQHPASPNGLYLSSSGSSLFHRSTCKSAARLSEKNRLVFATRDEAIQAGKRPCRECEP